MDWIGDIDGVTHWTAGNDMYVAVPGLSGWYCMSGDRTGESVEIQTTEYLSMLRTILHDFEERIDE